MATITETITRIADDMSRPESEVGDIAQREILTAIKYYESKRFTWNERLLTVTLSSSQGSYAYSELVVNDPEVEDIIAIDDPIKATYSSREQAIWLEPWRDTWARDSIGIYTTVPSCWAHWNNRLWFHPAPNNALVVQIPCHVRLATLLTPILVNNVLTPVTTNGWLTDGEELIRNRATSMVWAKKLQDMEMANLYAKLEIETAARCLQAASARQISGRLAANY